ncbi:MAG: ABC transporter permease [Clostridia bacterium]|nr:ABC transporter permease [Clostridia bacterium]
MGYSPFYFLAQTFKNIFRSKGMSLASVLVLMACLLVTGTFYTVNENLNYNLESLGQLNRILAYINEECPDEEIRAIKELVEEFDNVKSVKLISKEEALQDEMERLGEEYEEIFHLLMEEGDNPYRASLEIEYDQPEGVEQLEELVAGIEGIDSVQSRADTAEKVVEVKNAISKIFIALMALLFAVSFFIIVTTVKLSMRERSKEISVMRYIGASGIFIAIPFLLEGLFIGGVAAGLALFIHQYIYTMIVSGVTKDFLGILSLLPPSTLTSELAVGFFLVALLTGLVGSIISLVRHISD